MFRRWSGSVCSLMLLAGLTACPGSDADSGNNAGSPAAGSGGSGDPDASVVYEGDAGSAAGSGSNDAGRGGSSAGNGNSWSPAKDVAPAECRPDPSGFAACGGEVTGKWRLTSMCFPSGLEDLREQMMCPAIEQVFSYEYRVLVEFNSNGNYTDALKADAVQNVTVPKSCISEDADCSELGENDTDDSDGNTLKITSSGDNCLVDIEIHKADSVAGTWRVSGSEITRTDSTGPTTSEFCVSGNTLTLKTVDAVRQTASWRVFARL